LLSEANVGFESGVQVAALTDIGMRRTTNQDSHALIVADTADVWQNRGHLLQVADGMGAHAAGELASKLAADGVPHLYRKYTDLSPPEAIDRAVRETNSEVHRRGMANPDFHNMGTTNSVLLLLPQGAICAHIGDSRIYRLRANVLNQLTFDHSLQWELRASGQLPPGSELSAAVPKNVITRSLGPNAQVQVDLEGPHPIELGDTFLLCSDGLSGKVDDDEIGALLASLPVQEAAQTLVDLANLRGGPDNVTVLIARVVRPEATTAVSNARPLMLGSKKSTRAVHPALWVVAGVCLLAALVMVVAKALIPAGVAALGGLLAAGIGWIQSVSGGNRGSALGQGHMLGKGPYTSTPCAPSHAFAQKLAGTLGELRSAARDGRWNIDWSTFDDLCRKAAQADSAGNFAEAIRQSSHGITFMMKELRSQSNKKSGDSSVR
jgi:protein phosphatase